MIQHICFIKSLWKVASENIVQRSSLLPAKPIAGVVDWEFTYAAPVEFIYAPPWWLLIQKPQRWPHDLDDWIRTLDRRLQTSMKAMVDREDAASTKETELVFAPMRESWESGEFG
ncbi:hypothetical protein N7457_001113 [Penicillium paradoxum]|uniref:uncharacterized protein n=1 Tax=Penicillium paradoxum TaxID=176176 RepID=UPI0025494937|nr:uncharacterized protein N7457_001113 [Penicillium paradoxum]KAJ5794514.1 hypothetical protein N7457_001113 [Penicillium paradoxum]